MVCTYMVVSIRSAFFCLISTYVVVSICIRIRRSVIVSEYLFFSILSGRSSETIRGKIEEKRSLFVIVFFYSYKDRNKDIKE